MCVTLLGRPYEKIRQGDVSIRDSFQKNVSQRGLGSHRPHDTRAGLNKKKKIIRISKVKFQSGFLTVLLFK